MNAGRPTDPDPLPRPTPPSQREPLPRWTVPVVAAVVLLAAAAAGWLLWRWIDGLALADPGQKDRAAAQLDAVKLAASIAVGGGGLFALYLAARRQRTQELELRARHAELAHREAELAQRDRVQAHSEQVAEHNRAHAERVAAATERDAAARRVTELYGKGVEQLGSDKAPVRLGGLYALERLATQDNLDRPMLRQTVVDVLCAYLRMPYAVPGAPPADDADEPTRTRHEQQVQEREVRLTAQRILATHLHPGNDPDHPADTFWPDTDLDLTGATLINLDLSHCQPRHTQFSGARFTGHTMFSGARFTGHAVFDGATFTEDAMFGEARFTEDAMFGEARFTGHTVFDGATFTGHTVFDGATFTGHAMFDGATFTGHAMFGGASFTEDAMFDGATFGGATFTGHAVFDGATFTGHTVFGEATFTGHAIFDEALVIHPVPKRSTWPRGWEPASEHGPLEGLEGVWHRLVHVDRETFPSGVQDSATDPADG
ncbi:pentapeptide repeat-containing protein [Saccharothrix obliqua]|uniref:pentapeptide repeat-containing protein n=1 Tax=Saccharothrix obliqua TaxID=2861747 RepID=UPI002150E400|nr:pentapeptide repeat-containing protein [Saccharothrix obliqua]